MGYQSWIDKANENLIVAEWSHAQGHVNACANRVYYAMFHAAIAALIKNQILPPKTNSDTNGCNRILQGSSSIAARLLQQNSDDILPMLIGYAKRQTTSQIQSEKRPLRTNL